MIGVTLILAIEILTVYGDVFLTQTEAERAASHGVAVLEGCDLATE
jgi:hypothetical protein